MLRSIPARAWACAALVALCVALPAQGASPVEQRIANVERLVGQSSGVKQVEGSGNADAKARLAEARALIEQAKADHAAGNAEAANRRLGEATRTLMEAVRLTGTPAAVSAKHQTDFDRRKRSVDALVEAMERIGREKGADAQVAKAVGSVREMTARADALRDAGRVDEGQALLGAAHEVAAREVETLRGGDTLVRTLTFASKEEEYHYELDRNQTHEMLLRVLVEERQGGKGLNAMARKFVTEARALRGEAEDNARGGRYENAVKRLESSTGQLIRAIRSSGIYIPG
jgi:hypothetical protein